MISIETARELLDFAGGTKTQRPRLTPRRAEEQLQGAVAIHNILEQKRFAYLADEVGLGKTFVALGAFALFRHFNPGFRLLVIAPKRNIQEKWIKEIHNFTRNNFRYPDLRVKAIHSAPARPPIFCNNLFEFARETTLDPDRDFFVRMTSFGFGLTDDSATWKKRRDDLRKLLPWIDDDDVDLHSKDRFKQNYARAVCCAIPEFDLVILDEGHNLKAGLQKNAAQRNRLMALTFGNDGLSSPADRRRFPQYGPRAKRLLVLSATPIEDDYRQIYNQLDVFGLAEHVAPLADRDVTDDEKRNLVSTFLIRRVSSLEAAGKELTKNLYRREWRSGGVEQHDLPLPLPDDRQRLIVALVQKKVSEILADEKFNHSFQIGMLASFESFLETAAVKTVEESTFDDAEQTDKFEEREGIDIHEVNRLTRNYRNHFGTPMPHPKMDALVDMLRSSFDSGKKALVFVRRVASVKEVKEKLDAEYDRWLFARLRHEVRVEIQPRLERAIAQYLQEKADRRRAAEQSADVARDEDDAIVELPEDRGGNDTFFAWFFRGEGPPGVLSGAAIAGRFNLPQFALSSFFSDNYAADLLGVSPGQVFTRLQSYTGWSDDVLREELGKRAGLALRAGQKRRHFDRFFAFQRAAVSILAEVRGPLADNAGIVLREVFPQALPGGGPIPLGEWLETPTFFTALREREALRNEIWRQERGEPFVATFRRQEFRRETIASLLRLGHAFIDVYVTAANRLGRIETRSTEGEDLDNALFARDLLDLLEQQRGSTAFRAFHELRETAMHFDRILDVNAPRLWEPERRLDEVPREIGRLLRAQQPIGGMSGEVNKTLVAQFRMPAYPFVLVTTDLLQEGEDLHLFCSDVYHYGIAWMPSSTEQRIGRIDRVGSQTERRLAALDRAPSGGDLLQVYFPYLRETVEVFQVNRVLERLDRFIRLMHEGLGNGDDDANRKINILHETQSFVRAAEPKSREPLRSAFPVRPEFLRGQRRELAVPPEIHDDLLQRFWRAQDELEKSGIVWQTRDTRTARVGKLDLHGRQQGFTIFLHSIEGSPNVRCVSPVGVIDAEARMNEIVECGRRASARIAAVYDARFKQYNLTAEGDVLLGDMAHDGGRVSWLVRATAAAADDLERVLLDMDVEAGEFATGMRQEPYFER